MRTLVPLFALILGGCSMTVIHLSPVESAVGDGFEAREGGSTESLLLYTQRVREAELLQMELNIYGDPSMMDPTMMDVQLMGPQLFDPNGIDPTVFVDPMVAAQVGFLPQGPNMPL